MSLTTGFRRAKSPVCLLQVFLGIMSGPIIFRCVFARMKDRKMCNHAEMHKYRRPCTRVSAHMLKLAALFQGGIFKPLLAPDHIKFPMKFSVQK